jgi:hypothetical protein
MGAKKMRKFDQLDAADSIFLTRQLEHTYAQAYETEFPEFEARKFIPINNQISPTKRVLRYRKYNRVGSAKIIASYADDLPRSDVMAEEATALMKSTGNSYGYNLDEIEEAQAEGIDLDQQKGASARQAMEALFDRILWSGDAATGLKGMLNLDNVLTFTVPAGSGGAGTEWDSGDKTSADILADMIDICEYVPDSTNDVERVNTLLLPKPQYVQIATTPYDESSPTTILKYFNENYPGITVAGVRKLVGAGTAGADRMIAFRRDPSVLQGIIPREFEQRPVQERNLEFIVNCRGKIGGVLVFKPLAVAYGDGI